MESFRYHDLGRIAYADALEYQTAAFEVLLDAKATGKKEDNQLFFCEHLPVLTIGKSGKDSNLSPYTHLRAHETKANIVCRLLLEKKTIHQQHITIKTIRQTHIYQNTDNK